MQHIRRTPAERARHAHLGIRAFTEFDEDVEEDKDLFSILFPGVVEAAPAPTIVAPARKATPTPSLKPTVAPVAATNKSTSSSALRVLSTQVSAVPKPAVLPTSPSALSTPSSTTSTTPLSSPSTPAAPSTNRALAPAAASSSPAVVPVVSQSASADTTRTVPAKSQGLSGGAVGGIVAVIVAVILAAVIFFVRKRLIHRRQLRRNTWGTGMYPSTQEKFNNFSFNKSNDLIPPPVPEKSPRTPLTSSSFGGGPDSPTWSRTLSSHPSNAPKLLPITPLSMSYNNPIMDDTYGGMVAPSPSFNHAAPVSSMNARPSSPTETAYVRCVFIPTLPDELSINAGEVVRVLNAYDDGWALCTNVRGEQGMVPLECLARGAEAMSNAGMGQPETNAADWRNMRRISSMQRGI